MYIYQYLCIFNNYYVNITISVYLFQYRCSLFLVLIGKEKKIFPDGYITKWYIYAEMEKTAMVRRVP